MLYKLTNLRSGIILLTAIIAIQILITPCTSMSAGFTTIDSGLGHTLALTNDGTVWAWGKNTYGELGDGTKNDRPKPVQVSINNVTDVCAGGEISYAIKSDGTVRAWGVNNDRRLGTGSSGDLTIPTQVMISDIMDISTYGMHTIALKKDGTVWAWGVNNAGQLGDGSCEDRSTPVMVNNIHNIKNISAGNAHTLALDYDGNVWSWGENCYGQIGDGTMDNSPIPQKVDISNVRFISAGYGSSAAVKNDGSVWVWGWIYNPEQGSKNLLTPTRVNIEDVVSLDCGFGHYVALKRDGTVWCWGTNYNGQLGTGDSLITYRASPIKASDLYGVIAIASGDKYSSAIKKDGTIWGWGDNQFGQLGGDTLKEIRTPVKIHLDDSTDDIGQKDATSTAIPVISDRVSSDQETGFSTIADTITALASFFNATIVILIFGTLLVTGATVYLLIIKKR